MQLSRVDRFHVTSTLLAITLALTLANTLILTGNYTVAPAEAAEQAPEEFTFPTGTPDRYGDELGVSFEEVSPETPEKAERVIETMAARESITLAPAQTERYVNILYKMEGGLSCEYCCEADSVVTEEGEPACGCAHAAAMRGLTKYLLTETDMADQEILEEVSKWKTRFFPSQTMEKSDALRENGIQPTPVKLSVNAYRDVGSDQGGWVGDC